MLRSLQTERKIDESLLRQCAGEPEMWDALMADAFPRPSTTATSAAALQVVVTEIRIAALKQFVSGTE
jgi:hypothetical protein